MNQERDRDELLLEAAVSQLHDEAAEMEEKTAEAALERAWTAIESESSRVFDCDALQELLPAYRAGELSPERSLLVEDHARSCIPCRRALRRPTEVAIETDAPTAPRRWALAAGLIAALALAPALYFGGFFAGPSDATFELVSGSLLAPTGEMVAPVEIGSEIGYDREVITPRGENAVLQLADGSLVELRERSRLAVREGRRGTTIDLAAGNIVVEAAKQKQGRLYVATDDCLVAVKGTVFSVNHGTRGSRVAVFEGEVEVNEGGREHTLNPGDQVATRASLGTVSLADEIAWSVNAADHLALLRELTDLNLELRNRPQPNLRYSSNILELLPPETAVYLGLSNFSSSIRETVELLESRMQTSVVLSGWIGHSEELDHLREAIGRVAPLGERLGEELVIAGWWRGDDFVGPALLAESGQSDSLRADLAAELDALEDHENLILVSDPYAADLPDHGLLIWVSERGVIAAPGATALREVIAAATGAAPSFADNPFHGRLQSRYELGVGSILAVDLRPWVERAIASDDDFAAMGFDGLEDLIIEQRSVADRVERQANLAFSEARRGVASWLATPGPMMSLTFLSPDTTAVAVSLVEDPSRLFEDVLASLSPEEVEEVESDLAEFDQEHGWNPREDFLAALGGEVALALDGPLAPVPSWKLVIEVYDANRLQHGIESFVADANDRLIAEGQEPMELAEAPNGGWVLTGHAELGSLRQIHYDFFDGYLVATPSAALLGQASRFHDSAFNLATSDRISALLPADGQMNYSALLYQDLSGMLEPLGALLSGGPLGEQMPPEIRDELVSIGETMGPMLVYATGADDEITVGSTSTRNPLGLLQLLAVRDLLETL